MPIVVSHFITPNLTAYHAEAQVPVGTVVNTSDGGTAVYVQAMSAISTYNAVCIDSDFRVSNLTTTNAGAISKQVGFAQGSIASSNFAFVQLSGRPIGKLIGDTNDRVILFTTATPGVLDDATISAALVAGVVSKNSIGTDTSTGTLIVQYGGAFVHPHANPA